MLTEQHLKDFDELGYFIVDDAREPGMTGEMRAAARRIRQKVRAGEVDIPVSTATGSLVTQPRPLPPALADAPRQRRDG